MSCNDNVNLHIIYDSEIIRTVILLNWVNLRDGLSFPFKISENRRKTSILFEISLIIIYIPINYDNYGDVLTLCEVKNTPGYFSFYIDNISLLLLLILQVYTLL